MIALLAPLIGVSSERAPRVLSNHQARAYLRHQNPMLYRYFYGRNR